MRRNDVSVKIDADVYRVVRTVAAWRGVSISEYLSQLVRPAAAADLSELHKEATDGVGADQFRR